MKMNFEKLLNENKIAKVEKEEFDENIAEKDITAADHSLNAGDCEWALMIAYNAVLRISRNFMFNLGYRPIGKEHHKNVFEFLENAGFDDELVDYFNNMRKKRNKFIYGIVEDSSEKNAKEVIEKAKEFVHKIRTFVHKIRTEK